MRSWLWSAAVLVGACGDDLYPDTHPIVAASDLTIIAHQDDDLLFIQPDLHDAVKRKTGVTNVYVTLCGTLFGMPEADALAASLGLWLAHLIVGAAGAVAQLAHRRR